MIRPDWHPTGEMLLRALDGELEAKQAEKVKQHLQECWQCRARSEERNRALLDYVSFYNRVYLPEQAPPPRNWSTFAARLAELQASESPRLWERVRRFARAGFSIRPARPVFAAMHALVLFSCVLLVYKWFSATPVVSAHELLDRAAGFETSAAQGTEARQPVQRLRIRCGTREFERTVHRRRRIPEFRVAGAEVADAGGEPCRLAFERASVDWEDPLSARVFRSWYLRRTPSPETAVERKGESWRLSSRLQAGPVREAELIVRAEDYRATEERFLFSDASELHISEVAYSTEPVQPEPVVEAKPAEIKTEPATPVAAEPGVAASDLLDAELRARFALHQIRADLDEQITINRNANNVEVAGIVSSPPRKEEIVGALRQTPLLAIRLQSVDEVKSAGEPQVQSPESLPSNPPLLAEALRTRFPDERARREFVGEALRLSQDVLAHAFAMRELASHCSPDSIAELRAGSRAQFDTMVSDYTRELTQSESALQRRLALMNLDANSDQQQETMPWTQEVSALAAAAQRRHSSLVDLLISAGDDSADADTVTQTVRAESAAIQRRTQNVASLAHNAERQ